MLQLQAVKLLILQLEEVLTVGKALRQLREEMKQREDRKNRSRTDESRQLLNYNLYVYENRRMTVLQGTGNSNPTTFSTHATFICEAVRWEMHLF